MLLKCSTLFAFIWACLCFSQTEITSKKWKLVECIDYALENNISVKLTELDKEDSEIEKLKAVGSIIPSLSASANHLWNTGLNQNITTGLLENNTRQFSSGGINANLTLFNGFRKLNQLYRANLAILAAEYRLDDIKTSITVEIINAYLQILFNKETLKTARSQIEVNKEDLERTKNMVEQGVSAQGDLFEIEANVASGEQNVIISENDLRLAKIILAQTLLLDDVENFDIADEKLPIFSNEIMNKSADEITKKAEEIYASIKLAKTNLDIAEKDYEIAKGSRYPTLSAFYNYQTRIQYEDRVIGRETDPNNPTRDIGFVKSNNEVVASPNYRSVTGSYDDISRQISNNSGHSYGIAVNIPVFNGLQSLGSIKAKKNDLERKKNQYKKTIVNFRRVIYQTWNDVKSAHKTYAASEKTLVFAKEAHKYAKLGYKSGVRNIVDFVQAKQRLQQARSNVITAKYSFLFKSKLLEFYFGLPISEVQE